MTVLTLFLAIALVFGAPVFYGHSRALLVQMQAIVRQQYYYERYGDFYSVLWFRLAFILLWLASAWALAERLGLAVVFLVQ